MDDLSSQLNSVTRELEEKKSKLNLAELNQKSLEQINEKLRKEIDNLQDEIDKLKNLLNEDKKQL